MGLTLQKAAQWTSAQGGTSGKLEFTPINERLLTEIIKYFETYASGHTEEGRIAFQKPLSWVTHLNPEDFGGLELRGDDGFSSQVVEENVPAVHVKRLEAGRCEVSVMSLEGVEIILRSLGQGEKKLNEVRSCVEANSDPVAKILGPRFASVGGEDNSAYRFMEEIITQQPPKPSEKTRLKLLLQMQSLDSNLMNMVLTEVANTVRLNPGAVDCQVSILQQYCGTDPDKTVLTELRYMEGFEYVYGNGCRSPPWRQLHGDICYLVAKPHDGDYLFITASTDGFFINGGPQENEALSFDRTSEPLDKLVSLLRHKSPKFGELMDRLQSLRDQLDEDARAEAEAAEAEEAKRQISGAKRGQANADSRALAIPNARRLEPSLKWKTLGSIDDVVVRESSRRDSVLVDESSRKISAQANRNIKGKGHVADEEFVESSTESESEEEVPDRHPDPNAELPAEYWQIQRLVKYLKGGNQTATIIALCSLRDSNLSQETSQLAIRDVGGLELFINLLDTEDVKCKIGSLKILKEISKNPIIRRSVVDLGGLETMVKILNSQNKELKSLAAETIANVARFRRARRTVRQHGGIRKLVALLDCVAVSSNAMSDAQKRDVEVAKAGALALWSCSKSTKNKQAMRRAGVIPLLAKLLKSPHENMLIPVIGTLQECASESSYRLAIRTEGMIEDLVKNLNSENQELQMHCAAAIFKCAEDKETRELVRKFGGLEPLVKLLYRSENKELLAAVTGAIWKCAISQENVQKFEQMDAIPNLVALLNDQPEEVLVNVVGALGEMAKSPANRAAIRKANGISSLVNLLTGTNQNLLINVTKAVGECAKDPDNLVLINDRMDGVRLLWSLLKNPNPKVQASAAWAICPCIDSERVRDAGEMVRSFVGGLELIVGLLKSDNEEVLAAVCAAIGNIAQDEENLAVITDHNVVPLLARLTGTANDLLRQHLAEAIAMCCRWRNNREAFGKEGAVAPLVRYLKSPEASVHRSTARALHQLSKDADNCVTMHEAGVVPPLIRNIGSTDTDLQVAAAGCIANIRKLALANEKARQR